MGRYGRPGNPTDVLLHEWKAGLANGFQRVKDTLFLSESGDEYAGHAQVDFLDENWNVMFSTISDVKGTRLETPIAAMLRGQAAAKEQLMGVWELKMSPVGQSQSPLLSLATYGGDGSFITAGGYKALPPISAVQDVATELGPGYGGWVATGEGTNPIDVLLRDVESRPREWIPTGPGYLGLVGVGRRVLGTPPA